MSLTGTGRDRYKQLGATRSVLRQVITLADDVATTLSDQELRDRLLALADRARLAQRPLAVTGQDRGQRPSYLARPRPLV